MYYFRIKNRPKIDSEIEVSSWSPHQFAHIPLWQRWAQLQPGEHFVLQTYKVDFARRAHSKHPVLDFENKIKKTNF